MASTEIKYPWYASVEGDEIQQGDIVMDCPIFTPPSDLQFDPDSTTVFDWEERDVVVMSQSCDMEKGHEKITEVLLCSVWRKSEINAGHLSSLKGLEDARRGNLPSYVIIADCALPDLRREICVVDFRRVYSLPLDFFRHRAALQSPRIRLLPPYREHLAQGFAKFFMRVGLPVNVPPFK